MTVIDRFSGIDNFYLSNFSFDNSGKTIEHFFQAAKTDSPQWIISIMEAKTPKEAKRLGQKCPLREDWEQVKLAIMRQLIFIKFSEGDFANRLVATGDAELIEGNDWGDTYWGVCNGVGENHLGKLLMWMRDVLVDLREAQSAS